MWRPPLIHRHTAIAGRPHGSDATAVVKWDAHGNTLWRAGAHAARPDAPRGQLYAPVRFAGMVNGCIGVCDRIAHPCEFWTEDGLYAGGLFTRAMSSRARLRLVARAAGCRG